MSNGEKIRLSEKSLELTLCSQLSFLIPGWYRPQTSSFNESLSISPHQRRQQPFWFGLTQKQEARLGYDAATRLDRRLLLLQFKAGKRLKISGNVRYQASHQQLEALRQHIQSFEKLVFYVLPDVTDTLEVQDYNGWILDRTWLLDVYSIPDLRLPTRKPIKHYFYLDGSSGWVTIKSDIAKVRAEKAANLLSISNISSLGAKFPDFEKLWSFAKHFRRNAIAAALPELLTESLQQQVIRSRDITESCGSAL